MQAGVEDWDPKPTIAVSPLRRVSGRRTIRIRGNKIQLRGEAEEEIAVAGVVEEAGEGAEGGQWLKITGG
jgi:hypothetical protein